MRLILLFHLILIVVQSSAQIHFERAYFIDNEGKKVECWIKNTDWKDNPNSFVYRLSEDGPNLTASIKNVQEFAIHQASKYIRAEVEVDLSSNNLDRLEHEGNPIFHSEQLFLKVLLDGEPSLFQYADGELDIFFYKKMGEPIRQLIYKKYLVSPTVVGTNMEFQTQLKAFKCEHARPGDQRQLNYYRSELLRYLIDYHECRNLPYTIYEAKKKSDLFNLRITSGLSMTSFTFEDIDAFPQRTDPRLGIDLEVIFPFNKNKWAFFMEPNYQSFLSTNSVRGQITSINYRALDVPIGLRHYFFLNDDLRLTLTAAYVVDLTFNSAMNRINGFQYELNGGSIMAAGAGVSYKRFSAELRGYQNKDLMTNYLYLSSKMPKLSIIAGWQLW